MGSRPFAADLGCVRPSSLLGCSVRWFPGTGVSVLLVSLALALIYATVAVGVYRLRAWGRVAAILMHGLSIAVNAYVLIRLLDLRSFLYDLCDRIPDLCPVLSEFGVSFNLAGPLAFMGIIIVLHVITTLWFLLNGRHFQ